MPKRILIGTPLKGDVPKSYLRSAVMISRLNTADTQFEFVLLDGPAVMQARNEIAEYALSKGVEWFASPWDVPSVDFLEDLGVVTHKVASASVWRGGRRPQAASC